MYGAGRVERHISHYSRRSDRSFARRQESIIEIYDFRDHTYTFAETVTRTRTTYPYTAKQFALKVNALESENCLTEVGSPALRRFGLTAYYQHDERWVVPDLNCFALKTVDRFHEARTETEVTAFHAGEPPADHFRIPADFVERSPAEFEAEYERMQAGQTFFDPDVARRLTARYQELRSRRPSLHH